MFLFERILERLAKSPYSNNLILKGGLLISSMIGISERATMDMDTTVRRITMKEDEIVEVLKKILAVDVQDGVEFVFESIEPIREEDAYNNFRAHLKARYGIHAGNSAGRKVRNDYPTKHWHNTGQRFL